MKKFLLTVLTIFFGVFAPVFSEQVNLPSETGIVRNIIYDDTEEIADSNSEKQKVTVEILSGDFKGQKIIIDNMLTNNPAYDIQLAKGDKVVLHLEAKSEMIEDINDVDFFIADIKRDNQILVFAGIFALLLVIIGRQKGLRSIVSIAATVGLIFCGLVPLVLAGICPLLAAVITGVLATIITVYLVGGLNSKSTSAIIGTSASLIFAGLLSAFAIYFAHLTGFSGEETLFLYTTRPDLNFKGILAASMLIAALGALMDTSVSIASTINEIHETDKTLSVTRLFKSGMNVGRDIIGTMSNTLILVYLGSSLPLVLLSTNIDLNKFFNLNQVATEILSALTGSIAILACVPITAIVAAILVKKYKKNQETFDMDEFEVSE